MKYAYLIIATIGKVLNLSRAFCDPLPRCSRELKAPVTLYRIACVSDYFSYRIGVSFTLPRSDPVQHVGAKSLRSGGDTKSNPICAVP